MVLKEFFERPFNGIIDNLCIYLIANLYIGFGYSPTRRFENSKILDVRNIKDFPPTVLIISW